jgi:protein SCO1/2
VKLPIYICAVLLALSVVTAPGVGSNTNSYSATGVVEKIASDLRQITIHHQNIPNYMMEMTMDFSVRDTNELSGISPGDQITFTLVVTENDEWVGNIHRTGHIAAGATNTMSMPMEASHNMAMPELKPGDPFPDYKLKAEDGREIHLSDFRGNALAFTFFFTRCPLPDYCPRMNNYFGETRKILSSDSNGPTNWQFLSISFDQKYDTPKVLRNYAGVYRGDDTNRWLFASASSNVLVDAAMHLELMVMRQGNSFAHNVRTVVLDPQGRYFKEFDDNQWTPQELADAITQAIRPQ